MAFEEKMVNEASSAHISVNRHSSQRLSMDIYYGQIDGAGDLSCPEPRAPPPSYESILQAPTLRQKFNIQPREDEGREVLPVYSSAISLEGVFAKKMELQGAVHRAHDRNWYKVFVKLQGTALTLYKYKSRGFIAKVEGWKEFSSDLPAAATNGSLLKSYNLQHAEVGVAADYLKRRFVIRVRAEADQFLLSCHKIETFILWLQSLIAAIDVAPPLDDRDLPQDLSTPRPIRRRTARAMETNTEILREQQEIMASQFPTLGGTAIAEDSFPEDEISTVPELACLPAPATATPRSSIVPFIMGVCTLPSSNTTNPSISPSTGKWAPTPPSTPWSEMQYARRCMAILTSCAPRKSNLVIMKGKQWMIDWATGRLTKWVPPANEGLPEYGDVGLEKIRVESEREETWRIGQYGDLFRV